MNSGTLETGTLTSCLMPPPAIFWDSGMASRTRHICCAWPALLATTASVTRPSSAAWPSAVSNVSDSMPEDEPADSSISA